MSRIKISKFFFSLLLAKEVEELLCGNEDKFKGGMSAASASFNDSSNLGGGFQKPKVAKPASYAPIPNSTHLDAVPQPTPINRNRVLHKKVRTFPLCFDDTDPVINNSSRFLRFLRFFFAQFFFFFNFVPFFFI